MTVTRYSVVHRTSGEVRTSDIRYSVVYSRYPAKFLAKFKKKQRANSQGRYSVVSLFVFG